MKRKITAILMVCILVTSVCLPSASAFVQIYDLGINRLISIVATHPDNSSAALHLNVYANSASEMISGVPVTYATYNPNHSPLQFFRTIQYPVLANGRAVLYSHANTSYCLIRATDEGAMPDAQIWWASNVSEGNKGAYIETNANGSRSLKMHNAATGTNYNTLTISNAHSINGRFAHWDTVASQKPWVSNLQARQELFEVRSY